MVEVSIRSRNGAPSRKGCVVNGEMTTVRQATNEDVPPLRFAYPLPTTSWTYSIMVPFTQGLLRSACVYYILRIPGYLPEYGQTNQVLVPG